MIRVRLVPPLCETGGERGLAHAADETIERSPLHVSGLTRRLPEPVLLWRWYLLLLTTGKHDQGTNFKKSYMKMTAGTSYEGDPGTVLGGLTLCFL